MTTTRNNLRKLVRKFIYGILSLILIVLAYIFSQSTQLESSADNQQRFIESSAIVVSSDYEAIAHHQARTVQARWFLIPYQPQLRTWNNDEQTYQYYLQQRTKLNSPAQIKLSTLLLSTENIKSPAASVSDEQLNPITSSEGVQLLPLTDQQSLAQTLKQVQQAIQQGQTITDIAQRWSLTTVDSDFFSAQADDGIVHRDTFRQAVFSDSDLLQGDTKPRLFTLDAQHSLLYSYQDFLPAEPLAFDAVRTQLALALARSQAIRDSFQLAEQYRRQLNQGESLSFNPRLQIDNQSTRWISAYNDDIDADVLRLLLINPVQHWHINTLPSGDILLSYIFSNSYDMGRLGLIRRLNENSLFQTWQSAESDALMNE